MAEVPVPTNPVIDIVDKFIQGLIFGLGVNAAIAAAIAQFPFLGLPIISTLFRFAIEKVAGIIYQTLETNVAFSIIQFQTDAQKKAYDDALAALTSAHLKGDLGEIEKSKQDFKNKFKDLIHFGA